MNRLMINTLNIAITAALALGLSACNRNAAADTSSDAAAMSNGSNVAAAPAPQPAPDNGPQYAQVVSVEPVRQSINDPQRVCHDQVITHTAPPRDQNRIAGTAIGAVAGGLLGHMVGGGRGNTLTTVAGAVGGGYAGNRIEAAHQQGQVTQTVERRCDTVDNTSSKVVAFDVHYVYNGVTRTVRMDHDPGDRVQVQQGIIAVSDAR
ncbi:glycine zipper 2TM domain-containing protein [Rhodanobacter sp. MP1X3]|jgi:uncharacterized protein YcfJ|uniref:glycine zipper 2TM domain-containing protein n=1 Tax=Rhodanobacter sp. MP1X3 TaxID=2723086 RepID=UPI001616897D|nr:glycine zipper 2TM domain-containing protein [Rhodanobacter sp. MP1X3]MBB6244200.1 uncharacterized protein YcfJ [Rhodanobacter sp. MP1X3]